MLRNLLYSLFFHILFITLLALSTVELDRKTSPTTNITPLTINFLNENAIDDIKNIKSDNQSDKVKNLNLEEKIELYNKIKNLQNNADNNKIVYEKSAKKPTVKQQVISDDSINVETEENEFSYYYTPVYVAESKVNTEEKRKLIENMLKREELRKKMNEKNIVPKVDVALIKQVQKIEDIIKISQKPLVVKKKEDKKINGAATAPSAAISKSDTTASAQKSIQNILDEVGYEDIDGLISEINISENQVDEKYRSLSLNEIFNQDDYNKLKEIEENKIDSKYILSLREKINIQRQIKGCYKMAILRSKKDSRAIVALTLNVAQDGIIDMNSVKVNKIVDNFDDEGFAIALDNAKSALVFCSPLRGLPSGKYKTWKRMVFIFDSNNLE